MSSATEIKAADVQKLRQSTGAGLMECKKALGEAGGDFDKAVTILREKGIMKSAKRADRVAGEGLVEHWISDDLKEGILFEMNCETDFVARNDEFKALAKKMVGEIRANAAWTDVSQLPKEEFVNLSAKIGEKIEPRRFVRFKTAQGFVSVYIHSGAKEGALVQIDMKKAVPVSEGMKELGREIALQIVGLKPIYLNRTEVPQDIVEREKEITKKQMEGQKKPADIMEKIAVGKLQQFYAAQCLVDQPYVRDTTGKQTVQDLVDGVGRKEGTELVVARFARFRVGAE